MLSVIVSRPDIADTSHNFGLRQRNARRRLAFSLSNLIIHIMQNRTTFMERLSERLTTVESVLKKLEPVENLLKRLEMLEESFYSTKKVFTFQEACVYIGVSESMLYKLTANKEIPHYKPRGKMVYFAKEELDEWLLQNCEPAIDDATRMATESATVEPFFNRRQNGKRKKD